MNKTQQYRDLLIEIDKKRGEIMNSDEYIDLIEKAEELSEKLEVINTEMSDKLSVLKSIEISASRLLSEISESGEIDGDIAEFKYKVSNKVNVTKLFRVIDDVDAFVALASITQKNLKTYAKERPGIKKALEGCVEEVDRKVVGINIL